MQAALQKIVLKGDWGHLLTLTLTLDDLESHIIVNVSLTLKIPLCGCIVFDCGRTDIWTDHTDGRTFLPWLLGHLSGDDLKIWWSLSMWLSQGEHCFWKIIFHDFSMTFPGPNKRKSWPFGTTFFFRNKQNTTYECIPELVVIVPAAYSSTVKKIEPLIKPHI